MHQDDEYGKNVLDGFTQQLDADEGAAASVTATSAARPTSARKSQK